MARILVGLSGGVDSSVAAALLVEQGHDVVGAYMKNWVNDEGIPGECPWEQDIQDALAVAKTTGIEFRVIDLVDEYRARIVNYLIEGYRAGYTPNPDVLCNREMKFGVFLDYALEQGFDYVATGHYARVRRNPATGLFELLKGLDPSKDQSYFLHRLTQAQLSRTLFPVGELHKSEVRRIAAEIGLPNAKKKDSTGICFIGERPFKEFLMRYLAPKKGEIRCLDDERVLGEHDGLTYHTIGQRKGLGLSGGPWFVVKKDIEENTIYVSRGYGVETQYGNEFRMHDFHFITDNPWKGQEKEIDITFKIRHTPDFTKGKLIQEGEKQFHILSSEKLQGIAPGQFGVIYDEEAKVCVGSGEIIC